MSRIRVPAGTIQKLEQVFDDLQTTISDNQLKRLNTIFNEAYGIVYTKRNGVITTDEALVTVNPSNTTPTRFSINACQALTQDNRILVFDDTQVVQSIGGALSNEYYLVRLRYIETGSGSISAMSSFLYDESLGSTTKYTSFTDAFSTEAVMITQGSGYDSSINLSEAFPLAILKTNSQSKLDESQ